MVDKRAKLENQLEAFKNKALWIYSKNPKQAYIVQKRVENKQLSTIKNPHLYYSLTYILNFTQDFLIHYESLWVENSTTHEENLTSQSWTTQQKFSIDEDIFQQTISLKQLDTKEYKILSSFDFEARIDHIILQNVYLKNIGSVQDLQVIHDVYLVTDSHKIITQWYIVWEYFYFDIWNFIIKRDFIEKFHIVWKIYDPASIQQTWELILDFSTPNNAVLGTSNGLKAISYSNWSNLTWNVQIPSPIKTLLTKSNYFVNPNDFTPSFQKALEFRLSNKWSQRLDIKSFEFKIYWSFLNSLWENTEFVLKRKNSNQIFWKATKQDIINNSLVILHNGNDLDFISGKSENNYELEIIHEWNPTGSREIILQNIILWDGFGWFLSNLDTYSNSWLPTQSSVYRY